MDSKREIGLRLWRRKCYPSSTIPFPSLPITVTNPRTCMRTEACKQSGASNGLPTVAGSRGGSSSGSGSSSASSDRTANSSKEVSIKIKCISSPWITLVKQASLQIVPHFLEQDPFGPVQLAHTDVVYVFLYGYTRIRINGSSVVNSISFCSFVCIPRLLQCDYHLYVNIYMLSVCMHGPCHF